MKYLTLELEEVKEKLHECNAEWMNYMYHLENQHDIVIFKKVKNKSQKNKNRCLNEEIKVNKKRDRKQEGIFKDIYREIVKIAHPDITGEDVDMTRLMRHATEAKNKDDLMTLLDICDDLDITKPDLSDDHIIIMENNISSKENEIKAIQKSDAWVWFHADKKMKSNLEKEILRRYNK